MTTQNVLQPEELKPAAGLEDVKAIVAELLAKLAKTSLKLPQNAALEQAA